MPQRCRGCNQAERARGARGSVELRNAKGPGTDVGAPPLAHDGCMHIHHSGQSDVDQTLVGISFETPFLAQEFLVAMSGLAAAGGLKLKDAVTVVKDDLGKTLVHESIDPTPGRAALTGSMWVGLLGLILGGPIGWIAGLAVGAGAGAFGAKVTDLGVPDEWVQWFRDAVQPGTATIAMLVEHLDRDALVREAARFTGAELVYANLDERTMARLREALGETIASPDDTGAQSAI
jgi:uncharacterized membrane protein